MIDMYHENETKDKVLKAGLKMLNESGYGSLTISELARQAKISKQNLYYHYPSMNDVIFALAEQWSLTGQKCAVEALASSHEVGSKKILAISRGMFAWMRQYEYLSRLSLVLFQSGPYIKKVDQFMEKARNIARLRIRELLVQDSRFAKMKTSQIEEVITAIHSLLYGFCFYVITLNDFTNIDLHEKNCNDSLIRLIESYR